MIQQSIISMKLALEALHEAEFMREDKQNQFKRTAAIASIQASLASLQAAQASTVAEHKIELPSTVQWLARVNLECNIPDSRSLHVQLDDEPLVDEQKRYFWRFGWNSYRDSLHAAIAEKENQEELKATGWFPI